jgi:hypothetical protein
MANYSMTPPNWGGQDPNGTTTGHHAASAGRGAHGSISAARWAARRAVSPVQPLPEPTAPFDVRRGDSFIQGFVAAECDRGYRAGRAVAAGLIGAYLLNTARRNRGRR